MAGATKIYDIGILTKAKEKILGLFRDSKVEINIKFIDINDNIHIGIPASNNQIIVCLKSGEFRIFPSGISSVAINDALGVRRKKVTYWGVLPPFCNPKNPMYKPREVTSAKIDLSLYD